MTVNHDVVGSSPTAGARDTPSECFFIVQKKAFTSILMKSLIFYIGKDLIFDIFIFSVVFYVENYNKQIRLCQI